MLVTSQHLSATGRQVSDQGLLSTLRIPVIREMHCSCVVHFFTAETHLLVVVVVVYVVPLEKSQQQFLHGIMVTCMCTHTNTHTSIHTHKDTYKYQFIHTSTHTVTHKYIQAHNICLCEHTCIYTEKCE